MNNLNSILSIACLVTDCSTRQALSSDRRQKCAFARFIFFALATEAGCREYVAVWFLNRTRSMAYHYKKKIEEFSQFDKEFNSLLNKAREKYERSSKSI